MSALLMPVNSGKPIVLDKAVVFIGRHPDCDVLITHSKKISRKHCCIAQVNGSYIVRDLGSMNGVHVNGKRVTKEAPLREGDELLIGDCRYVLKDAKQSKSVTGGPGGKSGKEKEDRPRHKDDSSRSRSPGVDFPIPLAESEERFAVDPPMPSTPEVFQLPPPGAADEDGSEIVDFDDDDESIPLDDRGKFKDSGSQVELMPE
ncbi:MAG: FHA domain-containing protein [Planctomycetaceae bacterium]